MMRNLLPQKKFQVKKRLSKNVGPKIYWIQNFAGSQILLAPIISQAHSTLQMPSRHLPNTLQTLSRHITYTFLTLFRQPQVILQTPIGYSTNIRQMGPFIFFMDLFIVKVFSIKTNRRMFSISTLKNIFKTFI